MPLSQEDITALATALNAIRPGQAPAPAAVASTAIKMPSFWTGNPEVWFAQVEAQFQTRNPAITADLTKYNYVVGALDNSTASEVQTLITAPPAENKYETIKASLIKAFGQTQARKDQELLNLGDLGDRRPSALLRHIRGLSSDPNTLYKAIFLTKLPVDVRRVLAVSSTIDLDELAEEADRVMDAGRGSSSFDISAVSRPTERPADPSLCYFHSRFGEKARSCRGGKCRLSHLIKTPMSGNANADR